MNDGVFAAYDSFFSGNTFQQHQHQQQQLTNVTSIHDSSLPPSLAKTVINDGGGLGAGPFANIPFVQIHTTDVQPQRNSFGNVFRRSASKQEEIKSEPIKSESADAAKERANATPTPPARASSSSNGGEKNLITQNGNLTDINSNTQLDALNVTATNVSATVHQKLSSSLVTDYTEAFACVVHKCSQCTFISLSGAGLQRHLATFHAKGGDSFLNEAAIRFRITCPGCENIFYSHKSLEIHFLEDHLMDFDDVNKLLDEVKKMQPCKEQHQLQQKADSGITNIRKSPTLTQQQDTHRKSRIYLKNVDCLREPRREPIQQQQNQITEQFFPIGTFENDCNVLINDARDNSNAFTEEIGDINNENHNNNNTIIDSGANNNQQNHKSTTSTTKQKISIKSVDVLREPALLRRDYEMLGFNNFMNACSDLDLHALNNISSDQQFNYSSCTPNNLSNNVDTDFQKPRRPKIYIKNVDILKEPMILTDNLNIQEPLNLLNDNMNFSFIPQSNVVEGGVTGGASNFLSSSDNSSTPPSQRFDANLAQQLVVPMVVGNISEQYLFESATTINNNENSAFMPTVSVSENFNFANGQSSNCFLLDNTRFDCIDGDLETLHISSTPIITEPTPPPPVVTHGFNGEEAMDHCTLVTNALNNNPKHQHQQQKQKIFIKNVDILKEPQYQEQQRGTLHLRTVDELNLMNKNEVENLIAPNLDNTQSNNCQAVQEEEEDLNLNNSFNNLCDQQAKLILSDEDAFYANDSSFKLQDFDAEQVVNNWSDDYDLGEDIDCIITDTISPMNAIATMTTTNSVSKPMMTTVHDLDTPQMSLISIRDIEELTGGGGTVLQIHQLNEFQHQDNVTTNSSEMMIAPLRTETLSSAETEQIAQDDLMFSDFHSNSVCQNGNAQTSPQIFEHDLKQERTITAITATSTTSSSTINSTISSFDDQQTEDIVSFSVSSTVNINDVPPLAPVTMTTSVPSPPTQYTTLELAPPPLAAVTTSSNSKDITTAVKPSNIPMPPLVPVVFSVKAQHNATSTPTRTCTSPTNIIAEATSQISPLVERGRIYVASNLMESNTSAVIMDKQTAILPKVCTASIGAVTGGTSVRGRPFGSNRTGITKNRKMYGNATDIEVGIKCTVQACAFRFKKPETLEYHKRCHNSNSTLPQSMLCPECMSTGFNNWNTLHTHLWRSHHIDMELYSCELCTFKTPVYSRLINTHSKIHSEDRNYKCSLCAKAFKNTKQLKNHRRWHRNHTALVISNDTTPAPLAVPPPPLTLHHCNDCGAVFSHPKTLRSHICKNADVQVQCEICGRVVSSKSSLKLHILTHETTKRFKCSLCDYEANDHNAFRRHKMTHDNKKMYICPYCSYKSIQSVAFQKHVQQKHPDVADSIIHKCILCPFSTINQSLFTVHQAKHETASNDHQQNEVEIEKNLSLTTNDSAIFLSGNQTEITLNTLVHAQEVQSSKIKVKSNLKLTNPNKFSNSKVCSLE